MCPFDGLYKCSHQEWFGTKSATPPGSVSADLSISINLSSLRDDALFLQLASYLLQLGLPSLGDDPLFATATSFLQFFYAILL